MNMNIYLISMIKFESKAFHLLIRTDIHNTHGNDCIKWIANNDNNNNKRVNIIVKKRENQLHLKKITRVCLLSFALL